MSMKKSAQVPAALIVAFAATFVSTGCSSGSDECRDTNGNILPASACQNGTPGAHYVHTGGFGNSGYYGGSSGGSYGG